MDDCLIWWGRVGPDGYGGWYAPPMATKTLVIQVCDVCGAEGNLDTFRVGHAVGNVRKLDLCPADAEPIKKLLAHTKARPARKQSRTVFSDEKEIPTSTT